MMQSKWFLPFADKEIENKYYEDEFLRMMQVITYQLYLSVLVSVVLIIITFVASEYALLISTTFAVVLIPVIILLLAKKFPYKVNILLSINNLAWCALISALYMWRGDSIIQSCGASGGNGSSGLTDSTSTSCSHLFVLGGGFYTIHIALLVGTNFGLNILTFLIINSVYVLTIIPSIPNLICLIFIPPVIIAVITYAKEKNARLYYDLINKYYIWYYIANNILPQKIIITKIVQNAPGKEQTYQLYKTNRRARKEFGITSTESLQQFISQVELKQDPHQSAPIYPDDNNTQNLPVGHMDSIHSKSLGVISQFSKKSFTSRLSQIQGVPGSSIRNQQKLIPLDLLMRREIKRQNSNEIQGNNIEQQSSHLNNLPGHQYLGVNSHACLNSNKDAMNNVLGANNTTTQDQGAQHMRNKKRSLFQMEDQSIANPSQKQVKLQSLIQNNIPSQSNNNIKSNPEKLQQEIMSKQNIKPSYESYGKMYKGTYKNEKEDLNKLQLTLISFQKQQEYQLILIEDDYDIQNEMIQREQVQDEQMSLYKTFSVNFANIMQNETNMLNFYLQQMKQNYQIQKKMNNLIYDAFYLNTSVTSRINTFIEFYNLESSTLELHPKQFSIKKILKDISSSIEYKLKQNSVQLVISNECPPEQDMIQNDEKRIKHVLYYLLQDCIQNTQKGQIIISASSGIVEHGDSGESTLQGTIKLTIRDNSLRKYKQDKSQNFFFGSNNLHQVLRNKQKTYSDIELAVFKQLLKMIGPQGNIFYLSEEKNNANKVSFYIYTDLITQEEQLSRLLQTKLQDDLLQVDDEQDALQFKEKIQNSDDDDDGTYKNNNPPQSPEIILDKDNNQQGSMQNQSSIYLFNNGESRHKDILNSSSQFQLHQPSQQGHIRKDSKDNTINAIQQPIPMHSSTNTEKFGIYQANNFVPPGVFSLGNVPLQQSQTQIIQTGSNLIFSRNELESDQVNNAPNNKSDKILRQDKLQKIDYMKNSKGDRMQNSNSTAYMNTQPERKVQNEFNLQQGISSMRKSADQLFEECDNIDDENPISDIFVKELSQTSVKFKRELSHRMSYKTSFFNKSIEDLDYNIKGNSNNKINQNPLNNLNLSNNNQSNINLFQFNSEEVNNHEANNIQGNGYQAPNNFNKGSLISNTSKSLVNFLV